MVAAQLFVLVPYDLARNFQRYRNAEARARLRGALDGILGRSGKRVDFAQRRDD
jgi:hypothetical protein